MNPPPPPPLVLRRRVAFSQTDAAGLAHFSTWFFFMEAAEAELFRSLDLPLLKVDADEACGFPRVDVQCRFRRPVTFDQMIETRLQIEELDARRIHYRFVFLNEDNQRCASGSMVTAFARRSSDQVLHGDSIPAPIHEALRQWQNLSPDKDS